MNLATALLLLLAAAIKLAPVVGVLGAERLRALYGVDVSDPVLAILLRHRALLFGVVGGLLAAAAFRPELRAAAIVVGLASAIGFIAIAALEGGANGALARVVTADWVVTGALVIAAGLELASRRAS
ncbi:MAG: phosphopantetheine adenylyltransferase [Deltaproteobacteria bacterium]|nr:phosphopantetheine adenylyltransferase [Deltaproteobacteria bacterium]